MRTKSKDISKKQKVLNYLLRYGSIDRMTALTHTGTWDLGKTIFTLRKCGHEIKTIGKRHNVKYSLIDKTTGEPVSSRFIKPKSISDTQRLTEDELTPQPAE